MGRRDDGRQADYETTGRQDYGTMRDYTKIGAWKLADDLTVAIYQATKSFPRDEIYGIIFF